MANMFTQKSHEYVQQIDEEMERLQQLKDQVLLTIQHEEELEGSEPEARAPRKRSAKKSAGKTAARKRGRPRADATA